MKKKEVSNWDLTVKLLKDNESEIHIERDTKGIILYLTCKDIPDHRFNLLPIIINDNQTIEKYINKMTIYNFMLFYEGMDELLKSIHDSKLQYEKLIKEYKKEAKMTKEELITELKTIKDNNSDIEQGHGEADQLLLEYINDEDIASAFNDIEKWYA